jgi:hypothetical protein
MMDTRHLSGMTDKRILFVDGNERMNIRPLNFNFIQIYIRESFLKTKVSKPIIMDLGWGKES